MKLDILGRSYRCFYGLIAHDITKTCLITFSPKATPIASFFFSYFSIPVYNVNLEALRSSFYGKVCQLILRILHTSVTFYCVGRRRDQFDVANWHTHVHAALEIAEPVLCPRKNCSNRQVLPPGKRQFGHDSPSSWPWEESFMFAGVLRTKMIYVCFFPEVFFTQHFSYYPTAHAYERWCFIFFIVAWKT